MNIPQSNRYKLALMMTSLLLGAITTASASNILYFEDFNDSERTTLADYGWAAFATGSPSNPSINGSGTTYLSAGDRNLYLNINTTNATSWWTSGLYYTYSGSLTTSELSLVSLTARVWGGGSSGEVGDVTLRIQSSSGNWLGFTVSGETLAANPGMVLGGLLSDADTSAGTFDPTASEFTIYYTFSDTLATWGNDGSNIIKLDNIELSVIPEASSAAYALGIIPVLLLLRRRSRSRARSL